MGRSSAHCAGWSWQTTITAAVDAVTAWRCWPIRWRRHWRRQTLCTDHLGDQRLALVDRRVQLAADAAHLLVQFARSLGQGEVSPDRGCSREANCHDAHVKSTGLPGATRSAITTLLTAPGSDGAAHHHGGVRLSASDGSGADPRQTCPRMWKPRSRSRCSLWRADAGTCRRPARPLQGSRRC